MVKLKNIIVSLLISVGIGQLSGFITRDYSKSFSEKFSQSALTPPDWLFPIVWTILYVMMGVSSYLIYKEKDNVNVKGLVKSTLIIYRVQLFFNFFWSILFFKYSLYMVAFIWLVILWILVFVFIKNGTLMLLGIMICIYLYSIFYKKQYRLLSLICLIPITRFLILVSHSSTLPYMTYRAILPTTTLLIIVFYDIIHIVKVDDDNEKT